MSTSTKDLTALQARAARHDELAAELAATQQRFDRVLRSGGRVDGIDPVWRVIANALAEGLRPYTLFREQRVVDGRIVVDSSVPGSTLRAGREALDLLGRQVAVESYRRDGVPVPGDETSEAA
jgi:hypothetical protein